MFLRVIQNGIWESTQTEWGSCRLFTAKWYGWVVLEFEVQIGLDCGEWERLEGQVVAAM